MLEAGTNLVYVRDQILGGIEDFWLVSCFGFKNPKGFGSVNSKGSGYQLTYWTHPSI